MTTVKIKPDQEKFVAVIPKKLYNTIMSRCYKKQGDKSKIAKEALELYLQKYGITIEETA